MRIAAVFLSSSLLSLPSLFGAALAVSPVACSGNVASSGAGADGGAGDDSGFTGDAYNPAAPTLATATIGPLDVAAGEEKTVCVIKRLDNAGDIMATRIVADLAPGSHHLIVYRSTATAEQLAPFACSPFNTLLQKNAAPLVMVNKSHLEYAFPNGVGVPIAAHQMLRIEAHYVNAGSAPLQGSAKVEIEGLPLAAASSFQKADFAFWGTTQINVPPQGTYATPVTFQPGAPGMKIFAVTSHQHQLGTGVKVWASAGAGDTSKPPILDEKAWGNPQLITIDPPLTFDGASGLSYQCNWSNTTSSAVSFGESATQEMCFVGSYYYPSHGFDACLDGKCQAR